MPSSNTFSIKPINELICKYIDMLPKEHTIVDPFANSNRFGTITNDLDPQYATDYHMDATDFLSMLDDDMADMVLWDPPYCYDNTSEILTDSGFKNISQIKYEDKIATLNTKTNMLEYQHPTDIISRNYSGDMVSIESQSISMFVTPKHRCYIKNRFNATYHWTTADEIFSTRKCCWFKKACDWQGEKKDYFVLPSVELISKNRYGEKIKPDKLIPMKTWLKFLGLYLSEGCCKERKDKCGHSINIAQTKDFGRKYIKKVLDELGYNYFTEKNGFTIDDKQLFTYLSQFGKARDKYIPKDIKNLSSEYLLCLIESLIVGDGTNIVYPKLNKKVNKMYSYQAYSYYTGSEQLRDDFCEIALKCGYAISTKVKHRDGYAPVYEIHVLKAKDFRVYKKNYKIIHNWSGKIYCVTVPNSTLCVKRNGRIYWCGNSPRQVSECYKKLGQTVNMETTQASYWSNQKKQIGRIVKYNGIVITCGWNSGGIGKKYGFEIEEVLLVPHGGWHNDTIVVVERKTKNTRNTQIQRNLLSLCA